MSYKHAYMDDMEPIEYPITEELDLHTFRPSEVKDLLEDYFELAIEKGFKRVRVVHGKGTGALREMVHAQMRKSKWVLRFELCGESAGGWGATWAWVAAQRVER